MPTVRRFEGSVFKLEDFEIRIKQNGSDIRGDKMLRNSFRNIKKAKNNMTVADWKENRFYPVLEGYEVDVLYGDGSVAPGHTKLATVRDSYLDDD